jgi:hypothetical protein
MISRHIHRKAGVGCGIRLLKMPLAIRLGYRRTITKSLVIAVLVYCQRRLSLAALVLLRLCLEMGILHYRCAE